MKCNEKIKHLRERKNLTQQELADIVGLKTASAINKIEMGLRDLKQSSIATFAMALDVTPAELLDDTELLPITEKVYSIPVFESVSAGFGSLANESVVDYETMPFRSAAEASETLFIRVKGDSMSPKIETGDLIQVRQQTSVDSGDIAVVMYEGEEPKIKSTPKTKSGVRKIPVLTPLKPFLDNCGDKILFRGKSGYMRRAEFRFGWEQFQRKNGISLSAHQLRHGFATICYDAELDEKDAAELLGHSSVELTKDIYTHISAERQKLNADKLNNFVLR